MHKQVRRAFGHDLPAPRAGVRLSREPRCGRARLELCFFVLRCLFVERCFDVTFCLVPVGCVGADWPDDGAFAVGCGAGAGEEPSAPPGPSGPVGPRFSASAPQGRLPPAPPIGPEDPSGPSGPVGPRFGIPGSSPWFTLQDSPGSNGAGLLPGVPADVAALAEGTPIASAIDAVTPAKAASRFIVDFMLLLSRRVSASVNEVSN